VTVAKASLSSSPLFGNGMGTYQELWDLHKPIEINTTSFWNTSFPSGFNFFLSALVTQGALPLFVFLAFLASIIVLIKRIAQQSAEDMHTKWVRGVALFSSIFFIVLLAVHTPSVGILVLGAWGIGLLLGVASQNTEVSHSINYLQDPRKSFLVLGTMLLFILASFAIIFYAINIFIGSVLYSRALQSSEVVKAINRLGLTLQINQNDVYHRVRASLLLSEFNILMQSQNSDAVLAQNIYGEAINEATRAVLWNNGSAINWLLLSQMYQVGATGGNKELYRQAKSAGEKALAKNPLNPALELNMAQVALTQKDFDTAYAAIARSKEKKVDYIDAYLLRGQMIVSEGKTDGFVTELRAFLEKAPTSPQGHALLAEAYNQLQRYDDALRSILIAQQLEPSNLSYFGTYISLLERSGRKDIAIRELEVFKARFPQVTGVEERIEELRNKKSSEVLAPDVSLEDDTN
jgi:tetratricopeptide (TPR) repeat protein